MGHHINGKSSIVPLIDRLNRYPIGLPDSDILRRILEILFSKDEAYVASKFPLQESTIKELSRATGWDVDRLEPILEKMADKGLVWDSRYGGKTYYLLLPGLIGFFEFTFMKRRQDLPVAELARLMHEYLFEDPEERMGNEFFASPTPLTRSLPYEEHIPVDSQVTTYENAREIIKDAKYGAVAMCYCRHKKEHCNLSCEKGAPTEGICISLGSAAKFMVRRGFAEKKSVDELLGVIDKARELKLTHITDNIRHKPSFICNCCSCCCELLGGVLRGYTQGVAKAGYSIEIDGANCKGCGRCKKACNVDALYRIDNPVGTRPKYIMKVDPEKCLGCGACVSSCENKAMVLFPVKRLLPPEKKKDLFIKILKEKKRLRPFIWETVKTTVTRKMGLG